MGDSEVLPANNSYNIDRKGRPESYGESLLFIKREPVDIQTNCDNARIFRKIGSLDSQTLIIGSAYRSTNNEIDYSTKLVDVIRSICQKYKDGVVCLAGDLTSQTSAGQRQL